MLEAARSAMSQQEYGKAETILSKAVQAFPEDQAAHLRLAETLVTEKKYKEAYPEYEAAIALSPKPAAGVAPVGDPKLHFEAGTVANEAGLVERAEEHYSMAQTGDPSEPRYPLYLAMVQIKLGKDSAALASLVRATKLNPDLAVGWGTLAELALKENSLGLAMQHVDKARRLEPDTARWRVDEARILMRRAEKGDVEKALQLLLSLDKAARMDADVLEATGECFGLLRRPADAAFMYSEASKVRPDDADMAFQASLWYQRAGNEAEAERFGKLAQQLMARKGKKSGEGEAAGGRR
jgi:tetratricopeptide (TPR) repeat protein